MTVKNVTVTFTVKVTLDETKFTEQFMQEFRDDFYDFQSIDDHAMHLAQLAARGVKDLCEFSPNEFVEGYGMISEMGILAEVTGQEEEVAE